MKSILRLFLIIALVAIVGVSMITGNEATASLRVINNHTETINKIEIWTHLPNDTGMNPVRLYVWENLAIPPNGERILAGIQPSPGVWLWVIANEVAACAATFTAGGTVTVTRTGQRNLTR